MLLTSELSLHPINKTPFKTKWFASPFLQPSGPQPWFSSWILEGREPALWSRLPPRLACDVQRWHSSTSILSFLWLIPICSHSWEAHYNEANCLLRQGLGIVIVSTYWAIQWHERDLVFYFSNYTYLFCVCGGGGVGGACMWTSKDNLKEPALSFRHVGLQDQPQVIRLASERLSPWSHLAGSGVGVGKCSKKPKRK